MAYQGSSVEELQRGESAEILQQHIFTTYTRRMLQRRSVRPRYSLEQTIHWLSYLAWQTKRQSQSVLYIERLQPSWLILQQKLSRNSGPTFASRHFYPYFPL